MGYVYFIRNQLKHNLIKIGSTVDIDRRLNELNNTSVAYPFEKILIIESDEYKKIESDLHMQLTSRRVNKEWFELFFEDIIQIVYFFKDKISFIDIEKVMELSYSDEEITYFEFIPRDVVQKFIGYLIILFTKNDPSNFDLDNIPLREILPIGLSQIEAYFEENNINVDVVYK